MKVNKAKKLLLTLGLGVGMSISMTTAASVREYCNALLYQCEYGQGEVYQACIDYSRFCGPIP